MAAPLTQPLSTFLIPSIEPGDPESVRESLARAHTEFERGDLREALRHLRKAAGEADDAGGDLRAVALARAAADLATEVGTQTPAPARAIPASIIAPKSAVVPPPPPAPLPPASSASRQLTTSAPPPISASASTPSSAPAAAKTNDAALEQLLASGRAVRVAVKRSARDETLYIVRRGDGEVASLGARAAVIVLLDPDDTFFEHTKEAP